MSHRSVARIARALCLIFAFAAVTAGTGCSAIVGAGLGAGLAEVVPPPRLDGRARYEPIAINPEWAKRLPALVRVSRADEPAAADAEALGQTEVASCYVALGDDGTQDDALAKLRYRAFRAGANTVERVVCDAPEGWSRHCWQSVTCRGVLVRERLPGGQRAHRPELGTLAIVVVGSAEAFSIRGWGENGAKTGAVAGTATGAGVGLALCAGSGPFAVAICPATMLVGALFGAVGGTAVGRSLEASDNRRKLDAEVGAARPQLHAAQEAIRSQVAARLRERLTNAVTEPAFEPATDASSPDGTALVIQSSSDTVVEIHIAEVGIRSLAEGLVQPFVRARLRLVPRSADARSTFEEALEYVEEPPMTRATLERDGDALRRAFERGYYGLAEQVASILSQPAGLPARAPGERQAGSAARQALHHYGRAALTLFLAA